MLALGLASVLSACSTGAVVARDPAPAAPQPPSGGRSSGASASVGGEIVARTNDQRRALGLPALATNASLMQAAQIQADQMAAAGIMAHDLPGARYPTLHTRLDAVSYRARAAGENVAEGYSSAAAVVTGWMASPGHRTNIVSPSFTEMGAASARSASGARYYVQVFAAPL